MPQARWPSCKGYFLFDVGFAEAYECPHCGNYVKVKRKFALNSDRTSQEIKVNSIILAILGVIVFFWPFLMIDVRQMGSLDWTLIFTCLGAPTYTLFAISIHLYFRSRLYLKHELMTEDWFSFSFCSFFEILMVWKVFCVPCYHFFW